MKFYYYKEIKVICWILYGVNFSLEDLNMGKKHFKRKTNNRYKEYYRRGTNTSKEKKTIKTIRISLIAIWCIITLFVSIKYNSYVRFAMIWHFSLGIFLLYFGTVGVYLIDKRDRDKGARKIFLRLILVVVSIMFVTFSVFKLITIMEDIILGQIETRVVHVLDIETKTTGKGTYKYITLEDGRTYNQSRGNVDFDTRGVYKVNILPHSKIIIPLEKK